MSDSVTTLRLVLGDQLTPEISSLRDVAPGDVVLMAEVSDEATYVKHHKQKITLIFAAMRHFAAALQEDGLGVDYVRLDAPGNTGSLLSELARALQRHGCGRVVVTEPGEWRLWAAMQGWREALGVPVAILEDERFLCSHEVFRQWASGRKRLRMEDFYRQMRRRTGWLMDGEQPLGERWNYDTANRKALPKGASLPERRAFEPDAVTREVMALVGARFADHFGELDGFGWAVTRRDALAALRHFIDDCLPRFGDYQDAMKQGADLLYHAVLSPYLNIGLLGPREVCAVAIDAYWQGHAPLHAVEGFVRQILGWREYVRGIYWLRMPAYAETNYLNAHRPLPWFYWTGETEMNCLQQCIDATRRNAFAHHIQRLMVTGTFALLIGAEPAEVEEWYLIVYADAFEWVELPNTHGMILFADGGLLGSKPYAASGAYINRMSDYCKHCRYSVTAKTGANACPFNYLYWYFLMENEATLGSNRRLMMPYRYLARMSAEHRQRIRDDAERFLAQLE